jgi:curli biogenesis system outer membrane secretion channel CsgG
MIINSQKIQRFVIAAALASGILATGAAASAQTTEAPVAPAATSVSMSASVDWKAERQAKFDADNADARRAEFYKLGTSL